MRLVEMRCTRCVYHISHVAKKIHSRPAPDEGSECIIQSATEVPGTGTVARHALGILVVGAHDHLPKALVSAPGSFNFPLSLQHRSVPSLHEHTIHTLHGHHILQCASVNHSGTSWMHQSYVQLVRWSQPDAFLCAHTTV
jgi:hypothetical protein